jgi:flagellar L-ring protein precursor FlgH
MDGQGAYLFAQNKARREGDVLNVKLDGPSQKQVETKIAVIKKLLKRIEEQKLQQQKLAENPGGDAGANPEGQKQDVSRSPASTGAPGTAAAKPAVAKSQSAPQEKDDEPVDIPTVQTRIVERMPDGNLRIKGSQPFMLGKREYKVIVTGLIRPEDYNDEGVSANKLLDPQYDVVSIRRNVPQ